MRTSDIWQEKEDHCAGCWYWYNYDTSYSCCHCIGSLRYGENTHDYDVCGKFCTAAWKNLR